MDKYDSKKDTEKHQSEVWDLLDQIAQKVISRSYVHDASKFDFPEKGILDEFVPKLQQVEYGSEEYKSYTNQMKLMTEHHYKHNPHHPEFYENGIDGMSLIDIIEMLADWKAAGKRTPGGNIVQSLIINTKRFNISDQLYNILLNTIKELKWDMNSKEQNVTVKNAPNSVK